jgi:hypothetical protein
MRQGNRCDSLIIFLNNVSTQSFVTFYKWLEINVVGEDANNGVSA